MIDGLVYQSRKRITALEEKVGELQSTLSKLEGVVGNLVQRVEHLLDTLQHPYLEASGLQKSTSQEQSVLPYTQEEIFQRVERHK